eukprot:s3509_g2.t1
MLGSLQSVKESVLAVPSQLSTERIGALMAALKRWRKFAVAKKYVVREPTPVNWPSSFVMSAVVDQPLPPAPWEMINLILYARQLRGTNLVLACFILQCAVSCIRFEHFQRSRPVSDHPGWHRFHCHQGKRRVRGSRPGYEWATPEVAWQGFSMLKVLSEFFRHECLSTTTFLWPQVRLCPHDLWEINEGTAFTVDKALHQIGVPIWMKPPRQVSTACGAFFRPLRTRFAWRTRICRPWGPG